MRTFKVSDELYDQLKSFVVDPFDDTPDAVIGRLIEIAEKAKTRWSPFEAEEPRRSAAAPPQPQQRQEIPEVEAEDEVVLL